mgnify:CR=1 FL=1
MAKKDKAPTLEEVRQMFAEAGFPVGEWTDKPEAEVKQPPIIKQQEEGLKTIRHMLEMQVGRDKSALADAVTELQRIEHGGARTPGKGLG